MTPKRFLLVVLVAFLGLSTGAAIGVYLINKFQIESPYYAVYLTSGDIYIGKLSLFPKMELTDVYLLQIVRSTGTSTEGNFQLTPLSTTLWSPSKIYLNPEQVIFYGEVGAESQIARTIRGKGR